MLRKLYNHYTTVQTAKKTLSTYKVPQEAPKTQVAATAKQQTSYPKAVAKAALARMSKPLVDKKQPTSTPVKTPPLNTLGRKYSATQ